MSKKPRYDAFMRCVMHGVNQQQEIRKQAVLQMLTGCASRPTLNSKRQSVVRVAARQVI